MKRLIIISGAGISAESGIATFRDSKDGLWYKFKPEEVADIRNYEKNKKIVHEFYNARRVQLPTVQPNKAHYAIAKLQQDYGTERVIVLTQNVDDLFERAGVTNVYHVHGELTKMKCYGCKGTFDIGYKEWHETDDCPLCGMSGDEITGHSCKPGVIFFGENAPLYEDMYNICSSAKHGDIVAVIGTAGEVLPIAHLAKLHKFPMDRATTFLINKDISLGIDHNSFDWAVMKPATEGIDVLDAYVRQQFGDARVPDPA